MKTYTQFYHLNEATQVEDNARRFLSGIFRQLEFLKGKGIYTREEVDKVMEQQEEEILKILQKYFNHIKLSDIRVIFTVPDTIEFELWQHPFNVNYTFITELETPHFYCGPYLLNSMTPEVKRNLGQKFLTLLHQKIQMEPGFYHQLPPKLQKYFQAKFKALGTDFGFLE